MQDIQTQANLSSSSNAGFRWPSGAELGYICGVALMPYLLAFILLAF